MTGTVDRADESGPLAGADAGEELVVVAAAALVWVGAVVAPVVARSTGVIVIGGLLVASGLSWLARSDRDRRPIVAAAALLTGALLVGANRGAVAADDYASLAVGPLPSPVEVIGDPEPLGASGWRVEIRLDDGARVEAVANGQAGSVIGRLGVGERLEVRGRLQPVGDRPWLRTRHIVGRATITDAEVVGRPVWWRSVVEAVRQRVRAGGSTFDERPQALYHGLVLGEDRFQPPGQTLTFRLSGLSHLLAVSGQNVAFVLAAVAPLTGRLGPRRRMVALGFVLVLFALMTRLEPSVLRAVTTAGLSTWAVITGRARSGVGVLAVAVGALILADPFLVDSVGFQLSVAASAGILVLTPALTRVLPGPGWLVTPLATGLGAQMAVAPLLSHYFGPVSLVAIPANVLAGWAAAATMIWGMTIGPLAGVMPAPVDGLLQWPVVALLWWLELVAAIGARAPDPRPGLGLIAVLGVAALVARTMSIRWPGRVVVALAAFVAVTSVPRAPTVAITCGSGLRWFPAIEADGEPIPRSVLVLGPEAGLRGLEGCRRSGIRAADLVVAESGGRASAAMVTALGEVMAVGEVWAPPQHRIIGARRQLQPVWIRTGGGWLTVAPELGSDGRRLQIEVGR